ncbi:Oxo-4-hydroxy-4-carboxy-5-ureidoimidazoline decarboxylase [Desarmillaria ectypa]|nr:Oxo-4-hydroxy-4-carboxy-5-ureidoimidazoline decarboxylase [Desarmillaria ectypa]
MIPSLEQIQAGHSLPDALTILFEHSPILISNLCPQLVGILPTLPPLGSYSQLINVSLSQLGTWNHEMKAQFIAGHPRIGESKNLSKLSAREQGTTSTTAATPPEVLARLALLNACYEKKYPGLIYITFVNGRTRAAIAEEMEDKLGIEHSLSPNNPALVDIEPVAVGSPSWISELDKAVIDVGLIAKSRLGALGVE